MLYDMLKPKLPVLLYSLSIAFAVLFIRTRTVDMRELINLTLLICSTLGVLKTYAPKILESTKQGLGFGIGSNMVRG